MTECQEMQFSGGYSYANVLARDNFERYSQHSFEWLTIALTCIKVTSFFFDSVLFYDSMKRMEQTVRNAAHTHRNDDQALLVN